MIPREAYPFASHYFEHAAGGHTYRQHYLDEGPREGSDAVVMLHGNPTWSFMFRRLVQALRPWYRVIVPDHMGCGLSETPSTKAYGYTLKDRIDDVERLVQAVIPNRKITLVVHDWGGPIGLGFAGRHLESIERIVLMNTAAFPMPADKSLPWQLSLCRAPVLGPLLVMAANQFVQGALRKCTVQPLPPRIRAGFLHPYESWQQRRAVWRFVKDIPIHARHPSYPTLEWISHQLPRLSQVPTLICWGEQDFVFDDDYLAQWVRHLPKARVRRFPGAGHLLLEDANEGIVSEVRDFVRPAGMHSQSQAAS